jgi:hypothetical protein
MPPMTEEQTELAMRIISATLQGHDLDEFSEEAESEVKGVTLFSTGTQLLGSFEQYGGLDTLQKSVDMLHRVLARFPQGHHRWGFALSNLAYALMTQYRHDGDMSKLAETVDCHREALSLRPEGHPNRANCYGHPCTIHFFYCVHLFSLCPFSLSFSLCKTTTADCALRTVQYLFILLLRTVDCAHSCFMHKGLMTADCGLRIIHVYKVTH